MAECQLVKTDKNTFVPMGDELNAVQPGEVITVKYSFVRNPAFHRKMFALFNFVFDALPEPSPVIYRGKSIVPLRDFDTARKELIILAGFHEMVIKLDGTVKLKAKSISYAKMDNEEFKKLYSAVIDAALKVLPYEMTGEQLDHNIEQLMRFA